MTEKHPHNYQEEWLKNKHPFPIQLIKNISDHIHWRKNSEFKEASFKSLTLEETEDRKQKLLEYINVNEEKLNELKIKLHNWKYVYDNDSGSLSDDEQKKYEDQISWIESIIHNLNGELSKLQKHIDSLKKKDNSQEKVIQNTKDDLLALLDDFNASKTNSIT